MGYTRANAIPIIFPPGSTETQIEVPITNDQLVEGTERFLGRIISGGGIAGLDINVPTAIVNINDDDCKSLPISLSLSLSLSPSTTLFYSSLTLGTHM